VLGERWSIHADQARAVLTAAEFHAAAGRYRKAALCFSKAQTQLAEAEIECHRKVREETLRQLERSDAG
jgi:hypothetical protein